MTITKQDLIREQAAHAKTREALAQALAAQPAKTAIADAVTQAKKEMQIEVQAALTSVNAKLAKAKAEAKAAASDAEQKLTEANAKFAKAKAEAKREKTKADKLADTIDRMKSAPTPEKVTIKTREIPRKTDTAKIAELKARIDVLERECKAAGLDVPK